MSVLPVWILRRKDHPCGSALYKLCISDCTKVELELRELAKKEREFTDLCWLERKSVFVEDDGSGRQTP